MLRTHTCGELRKEHIGTEVSLAGWVNRRRDHGGLIFIDLRDRDGVVQTVFNPEISPSSLKTAEDTRSEFVVRITGEVALRPAGTENPRIPTGDIEVIVKDAGILNTSNTPPFYINEEVEVDENLRLKYRYLDLRRPRMKENMLLRHRVVKFMRDFLDAGDSSRWKRLSCSRARRREPGITWCRAVFTPASFTLCRSRPSSSSSS